MGITNDSRNDTRVMRRAMNYSLGGSIDESTDGGHHRRVGANRAHKLNKSNSHARAPARPLNKYFRFA